MIRNLKLAFQIRNISTSTISSDRNRFQIDVKTRKKLAALNLERKKFKNARIWDDNIQGGLTDKNLPYYLEKLEKLAFASLDEKRKALFESSSFLATMVIDRNGVLKTNYYRQGRVL